MLFGEKDKNELSFLLFSNFASYVREKSSDIYILTQTLRRKNYMVAYQNILF
jgi:hypothetical protein